jgi:hypothetical protein
MHDRGPVSGKFIAESRTENVAHYHSGRNYGDWVTAWFSRKDRDLVNTGEVQRANGCVER